VVFVVQICEYAERKWASKVLKHEATYELPPVAMYVDATKIHTLGVRGGRPGSAFMIDIALNFLTES
jgi:hypothetical protein